MQHILIEVERYKRQVCGDSDGTYYQRLKECLHEEDWEVKSKLTVVHGFWRETIFLWKKVNWKALSSFLHSLVRTVASLMQRCVTVMLHDIICIVSPQRHAHTHLAHAVLRNP